MMRKNNTQGQTEKDGSPTTWPIHVVPLGDFREHTVNEPCWCNPTLDTGEEWGHDIVFVHHSMDKREEYEQGRLVS